MFGALKALKYEEYKEIYELTGLDADGRRHLAVAHHSKQADRIATFISFTKCIPGFLQLSKRDQTALIKSKLNRKSESADEKKYETPVDIKTTNNVNSFKWCTNNIFIAKYSHCLSQ